MRNRFSKWITLWILCALSFVVISCHSPNSQNTTISECRVVQHSLGEVCVPINPQRIIALDTRHLTDPLLAMGIKPIGIPTEFYKGDEALSGLSPVDIQGITKVGTISEPSLEKILMLKPDLILGMSFAHEKIYDQLSAIAPTVIVKYNHNFKENLIHLAQVLDKSAGANKVLAKYQNRIERLKKRLNLDPKELEVTVLIYYGNSFVVTKYQHGTHLIFSDIGVTNKINNGTTEIISAEILDGYDADLIFIMDYESKPQSFFLENPLLKSLRAFKNNRVYFVDADMWSGNGPLFANRMLDDLEKYLVSTP